MKQSDVFFFDVDGTILDNDTQSISDKTVEALQSLIKQGYKIAMCTGRSAGAITKELRHLVAWDAYVLANGAVVLDRDYKEIYYTELSQEFLKGLLEIYPEPIILEGDEMLASAPLHKGFTDFLTSAKLDIPKVVDYNGQKTQKITLEHLDLLEGGIDHPIFDGFSCNLSTHGFYEIYPTKVNKANGIKKASEFLNAKKITFFGDGLNDLEALRFADIGVAMGNAIDEVKEHADLVTKSIKEDGIYYKLKEHQVI